MVESADTVEKNGRNRIQNFIFARELAEVYLLFDHLSGRSDKSLSAAFSNGESETERISIEKICEIAWPPKGSRTEQAAQAALLLRAKDRLNAAAKPA